MKNILTLTLIFFSFQGYSQTLEGLLLRIQTMENTSMTIVDYNKIVDSIANRRDMLLKKDLQDWGNSGLRILRGDISKLDTMRSTHNAAVQAINVNQLVALQNQITGLLTEIEALKLRITNLKITIQ